MKNFSWTNTHKKQYCWSVSLSGENKCSDTESANEEKEIFCSGYLMQKKRKRKKI